MFDGGLLRAAVMLNMSKNIIVDSVRTAQVGAVLTGPAMFTS